MKNVADKIENIFMLTIAIIAIGCIVLMVASMITYEPKTISYGGGHVSYMHSKDGVVIYNSNNSSHLIVPIDVNTSTYVLYTWNGTAWEVDNFIGNNNITHNLTMQDLIDKSDWSCRNGY